jgi:hypothetical protein
MWTPDGAGIVFAGEEEGQPMRLYTQKLTDSAPVRIGTDGLTLPSPFGANLVSPDGAVVLASTADRAAVLVPLSGGAVMPARGLRPDDEPLDWEPDGKTMIVAESGSEWPVALVRVDLHRGSRTTWREVISLSDVRRPFAVPMALSRDRRLIAFSIPYQRTTLYLVSFADAE